MRKQSIIFLFVIVIFLCCFGSIDSKAEGKFGDFYYEEVSNGVKITSYYGNNVDVVIPDDIDGKPVVEIGRSVFYVNSSIKSVTIPKTVKSIGTKAFSYCKNLEKVTFTGAGLENIEERAFESCEKLSQFSFPNTLHSIGECAFIYCALTNVDLTNAPMTSMGRSIFSSCRKLTKISFPATMTVIPESVCSDCTSLQTVSFNGNQVSVIEKGAFRFCSALTSINIPDSVTKIETYAFGSSGLTSISLSSNVKEIGYSAFDTLILKTVYCPYESYVAKYFKNLGVSVVASGTYLKETSKTIYLGEKVTLKLSNNEGVTTFKSSNPKVVSVSKKGVIKGLKKGSATITATNGKSVSKCKVKVKDYSLNVKKADLTCGFTLKLKLNGNGKGKIKWSSSDKSIAKVSSKGVVTAKKAGKVKITAKKNGKKYTCKVTVKPNEKVYDLSGRNYNSQYNAVVFDISKIYQKGNIYVVDLKLINRTSYYVTNVNQLDFQLDANGKGFLKKVVRDYPVKIKPYGTEIISIEFNGSEIKSKKVNLRSATLTNKSRNGQVTYIKYSK